MLKTDVKRLFNNNWKNQAVIVALSLLSGWGTFCGLLDLMGGFSQENISSTVMALMLSLIVQYLLVVSLHRLLRKGEYLSLGVYILCAFLSVTFAQSFWMKSLHLNVLQADLAYQHLLQDTLAKVQGNAAKFEYLRSVSALLATRAEKLAQKERQAGFTCGAVPGGPGRRAEYREQDQVLFSSFRDNFAMMQGKFSVYQETLEALALKPRNTANLGAIRSLVNEVNALMRTPELDNFKTVTQKRAIEALQGAVVRNKNIRCPFAELSSRVGKLQSFSFQPINIADIVDPENQGANIIEAFRNSLLILFLQWDKVDFIHLAGFMVGLFIDLAIFYLSVKLFRSENFFTQHRDTLFPELQTMSENFTLVSQKMMQYGIKRHFGVQVYVPVESEDELLNLLHYLGYHGHARFKGTVSLWRVPRLIRRQQNLGVWQCLGKTAQKQYYYFVLPHHVAVIFAAHHFRHLFMHATLHNGAKFNKPQSKGAESRVFHII